MRIPKLDLRTAEQIEAPRKTRRLGVFFVVLFLFAAGAVFSGNVIFSEHPIIELGGDTFLGQIRALVRAGDKPLTGEDKDRVNILILGVGGAGHDGPELTDTVLLASFKPSAGKVALISIPRDLLVKTKDFGAVKLNAVNAYAESRSRGTGPAASAAVVSEALGMPVNYWARIDFSGFEKAIDAVGGVDVTVDRSFADPAYPLSDGSDGVMTVSFKKGTQHMDGKTALIFARSRHGSNGEGSDFARSKRQEKILVAMREKLMKAGTLLNPFTLNSLMETVRGSLYTNLASWEALRLAREAANVKAADISTKVMSNENVLADGMSPEGAYVLTPKNGDWSLVADFAKDAFAEPQAAAAPEAKQAPLTLEIQNGTAVSGLAQRTATALSSAGFKIAKIGNAQNRDYEKTVIYDLTEGKVPEAVAKIRALTDANVSSSLPSSFAAPSGTDLLIILGKDAAL